MGKGYTGQVLRVNLSDGKINIEHPNDSFYRTYFGGRGLIAYYLYREVPAKADPLGPENKLIFATGPLTGLPVAGSGRNSVGAKSPLTGGYGDAEAGGFWGAELKRAGFDAIIVEGQSPAPVYLWVHDGEAEIRPAEHLWGRLTADVEKAIKEELGDPYVRVAQIGPAGEKLVRYATVVNDLTHFAGRSGLGAVMGSKRLRAIAVRGHKNVEVADAAKLRELARWMGENYQQLAGGLYEYGTAGGVVSLSLSGGLPTRNFQQGSFEGAEKISGQAMRESILVDRDNCFACPIRCKRVVKVEGPYSVDPVYGGPEYETVAALGSNCGVDDLKAIAKGNERCAALGLDTISTGVAISFAMEAFEKGILTRRDTEGIELRFGNAEALLTMIEKIAARQGLGDLLAEGVKRAAEKIGGGAEELAIHVKGQEVPMHEPRLKHALGVGYAFSPTGADHVHNIHDTAYTREGASLREARSLGILTTLPADYLGPEKIRLLYYEVNWRHFMNLAELCVFVPWTREQVVEMMKAATGWNTSIWELAKAGERVINLTRLFNLREGFSDADDRIPRRFFTAFSDGPLQGKAIPPEAFAAARQLYYEMLGWDAKGHPTPAKLHELGLGWLLEGAESH